MDHKGVIMNRRFRLMHEFEVAEKGKGDMTMSLGLENAEDRSLTNWNAMLMGPPNTKFERMFSLKLVAGKDYPAAPPLVKFVSKVNLPCVNPNNGAVERLPLLANWNPKFTLEDVLKAIKEEMKANKGLNQPPEEARF